MTDIRKLRSALTQVKVDHINRKIALSPTTQALVENALNESKPSTVREEGEPSFACPTCGFATTEMTVYLCVEAPSVFYGNLSKKRLRNPAVHVSVALWETAEFRCLRPKCGALISPMKRVRLESTT